MHSRSIKFIFLSITSQCFSAVLWWWVNWHGCDLSSDLKFEPPKILLLYTLGQPNEAYKSLRVGGGEDGGPPKTHIHTTITPPPNNKTQQQKTQTKTHTLGSNTRWRGLATHFFVSDCVSGEIVWNVGTGESLWNLNGESFVCWHLWNKVCCRSLVLCSRCRTELRTARSVSWLKIVLTEQCELIMAEDPPHRTMRAYHGWNRTMQQITAF